MIIHIFGSKLCIWWNTLDMPNPTLPSPLPVTKEKEGKKIIMTHQFAVCLWSCCIPTNADVILDLELMDWPSAPDLYLSKCPAST